MIYLSIKITETYVKSQKVIRGNQGVYTPLSQKLKIQRHYYMPIIIKLLTFSEENKLCCSQNFPVPRPESPTLLSLKLAWRLEEVCVLIMRIPGLY